MDRARTLSMYRLLRIFGLAAATMLLTLLLHLLIVHLLTARDAPLRKDTEYVIRHIDTCPSVGYYFKREPLPNTVEPGPCYLCFCQEDQTAVCWKRDNRRCNKESFHYHGVGKRRDTRIRRSPGFADIFFRDSTRDALNKNEKTQCKPFESSFSEDCPPVDWCIGCTVCDCDANGRWDCHVLSFCPDKKGKKKSKRKGPVRKIVAKKPVQKSKSLKPSTNIPKRTPIHKPKNTKLANKPKTKTTPSIARAGNSKTTQQKRIFKKSIPVQPIMTPKPQNRKTIRYKRISHDKPDPSKKVIIKKDIATHRPIDIKSSKVNLEMEIAKKVMKKVMANLRKSINGEMVNMTNIANKEVQKQLPRNAVNNNNLRSSPVKTMNKRQVQKPQKKPAQRKPPQKKPPQRKPQQKKPAQRKGPQRKPAQRKPAQKKLPQKYQKKVVKKQVKKPSKKPVKKPSKKQVKKAPYKPKKSTKKPPKYGRHKRDVMMAGDIGISNVASQGYSEDSVNTTVAFSLAPVTSNVLVPEDDNCTHTVVPAVILPANEYYKYLVGAGEHIKEEPKVEIRLPMNHKETTEVKITETVFNLIGTEAPSRASGELRDSYNSDGNKTTTLSGIKLDANELKYSKWSHLKLLKEKKFTSAAERYKSLVKIITPINKTHALEDLKHRVHGKDVERKLNNRKYSLIKLLAHSKFKGPRGGNDNSSHLEISTKKIADLQNLLTKLLKDTYNETTTRRPKKARKFSVLRYFKRIFNRVFKRKRAPGRFSKHHIIETLCENFGPCKVSLKDKGVLKTKLAELDTETSKILRTVKIIKGLLKLLHTPNNSDSSTRENIRNDIQKLNDILKGNYNQGRGSLSATELTQIDYIKRNTQDFIQSVSNFATLLNEIISLMTKHDTNIAKNSNRILRNSIPNTNNFTKDNPFQSLRNLLERYNLIQNSFMKKMYEQLNNFENKMNENPKVSEVKDMNNSVAIENFSRNIIHNLRKLKRLAQSVSYSGRTKREAMRDDDAIEYLLILMEYLWKQNHPLDAAPVNDGIDLLIEAIKNAPDIKPIKKKVLEYTPAYTDGTTTAMATFAFPTEDSISDDESPSDSDKTSSEDMNHARARLQETEDRVKNKIVENKELAEIIIEDDKEQEDKYQFDRRVGMQRKQYVTESALYNRVEDNLVIEPESGVESTTTPRLDISDKSEKDEVQEDANNIHIDPRPFAVEDNNLDKPILENGVNAKKFEVFTADMDDEPIIPSVIAITVSELPSPAPTEMPTQARKSKNKMRQLKLESQDSENIDKQSKLEWIEENFGREEKKEISDIEEHNVTDSTTVLPNIMTTRSYEKVDVSVLTREDNDEVGQKKKKLNSEDVMLRKQMDLLNSLDYGTEKSETEESESKDGNVEDKYSNDPYPSYFV